MDEKLLEKKPTIQILLDEQREMFEFIQFGCFFPEVTCATNRMPCINVIGFDFNSWQTNLEPVLRFWE